MTHPDDSTDEFPLSQPDPVHERGLVELACAVVVLMAILWLTLYFLF